MLCLSTRYRRFYWSIGFFFSSPSWFSIDSYWCSSCYWNWSCHKQNQINGKDWYCARKSTKETEFDLCNLFQNWKIINQLIALVSGWLEKRNVECACHEHTASVCSFRSMTGSCLQIGLEQAMNEVKVAQAWQVLSTWDSEDTQFTRIVQNNGTKHSGKLNNLNLYLLWRLSLALLASGQCMI